MEKLLGFQAKILARAEKRFFNLFFVYTIWRRKKILRHKNQLQKFVASSVRSQSGSAVDGTTNMHSASLCFSTRYRWTSQNWVVLILSTEIERKLSEGKRQTLPLVPVNQLR